VVVDVLTVTHRTHVADENAAVAARVEPVVQAGKWDSLKLLEPLKRTETVTKLSQEPEEENTTL
jgi:hypothetical protein